jgi:hypothetical protein
MQPGVIVGDDSTDPEWEWTGPDGLTDSQRGKIIPDSPDKEMTAALR